MTPFARFAFFAVARDASFVTLAAATLMVAFSFEPPLAFKIGATVALIFSIGLIIRSYFLTEERLLRSEVWRALRPDERPAGIQGASVGASAARRAAAALRQSRLWNRRYSLQFGLGAFDGPVGALTVS
jgi:hypothetical protein